MMQAWIWILIRNNLMARDPGPELQIEFHPDLGLVLTTD